MDVINKGDKLRKDINIIYNDESLRRQEGEYFKYECKHYEDIVDDYIIKEMEADDSEELIVEDPNCYDLIFPNAFLLIKLYHSLNEKLKESFINELENDLISCEPKLMDKKRIDISSLISGVNLDSCLRLC